MWHWKYITIQPWIIHKCQMQNKEKMSWSQMIKKYQFRQEMIIIIPLDVSLQLQIVNHKSDCYAESQRSKSFFSRVQKLKFQASILLQYYWLIDRCLIYPVPRVS